MEQNDQAYGVMAIGNKLDTNKLKTSMAQAVEAEEEAYALGNGAVIIVRTDQNTLRSGPFVSAALGSLHNTSGAIHFNGPEAMKKLRDVLLKHVPLTLAELNAAIPDATAKELQR